MQLKISVLAVALISSVVSLSANQVPVRDGSNSSRAPLPSNRPTEFVSVINVTSPANTSFVANHIGGPTSTQVVTVRTPRTPQVPAIARIDVRGRMASK